MALTLKSLRKEGIDVSANPEAFAKEEALDSKDLKNKFDITLVLSFSIFLIIHYNRVKSYSGLVPICRLYFFYTLT
jgi:hypothetical protein